MLTMCFRSIVTSHFDTNRNVTKGPAKIALKKYTVTKSGNILTFLVKINFIFVEIINIK